MTPAATVRTDLTRVLDLGSEPGDDRDLRVRKRTAVAATLVLMSVAVVIGATDADAAEPIAAALAAVQLAVFGTSLLLFRPTHRLAALIVTMAIAGMTF